MERQRLPRERMPRLAVMGQDEHGCRFTGTDAIRYIKG